MRVRMSACTQKLTTASRANYFNYINMTNPDVSGMLRFLTNELQAAEDAGDPVWIMGHVLTGWDGTNPLSNPTDLCELPWLGYESPTGSSTKREPPCSLPDVGETPWRLRSYVCARNSMSGLCSVDRFSPHVIKGMTPVCHRLHHL